jgi:hypothetical protein
MPAKKYRIKLQVEERRHLQSIVRKQMVAASKRSKATALLLSDENSPGGALKDELVAERTGMSVNTLARIRQRCCEVGPVQALERKARLTPPVPSKIDGKLEARLIAEACSPAPEGHSRWTLRLLAERLVELELVESISYETVRVVLKKTGSSLGSSSAGVSRKRPTRPS